MKFTTTIKLYMITCIIMCISSTAFSAKLSVTVYPAGADPSVLLPSRAWVQTAAGRHYKPSSPDVHFYERDQSFSSYGSFTIDVPPGPATIHIERGKEYFPVEKTVTVKSVGITKVNIPLKRWINMNSRGWFSADLHGHFGADSIEVLKAQALADDVNIEPVLTLWNAWRSKNADLAWGSQPDEASFYADPAHLITLRNIEIERIGGNSFESVGALLVHGLEKPIKIPSPNNTYPCDSMIARKIKAISPDCLIDTDKPIWGENVIGVALGLFDSVQLCHNHYHRNETMPLCCGMASQVIENKVTDFGPDELFHRTNSTYYSFLNCGFKLAATGGSAMGVMPLPLGYSRTYIKLDAPLTEQNYINAIRAGKTFATSGPILILTADDLHVGSSINYSSASGKSIQLTADLKSIDRVDSLELIYNGNIIKQIDLSGKLPNPVLKSILQFNLKPHRSGWVAARAVFKSPDGVSR